MSFFHNQLPVYQPPQTIEDKALAFIEEKISTEEDKAVKSEFLKAYIDLVKKILDHRQAMQKEGNQFNIENNKIYTNRQDQIEKNNLELAKIQNRQI